uniref:Ran-binding protein 10 n=1 Tax=Syphacia muris TaxID=451379 RepID=A0A158R5R7_9BILA
MDSQPWSLQVEGSSNDEDEMSEPQEESKNIFWNNDKTDFPCFPMNEDDREGQERLKKLYPYVDEKATPLPRRWSAHDKCNWLILSHDSLSITYSGQGKNQKDAAAVRSDHPIPLTCGVYYFEVLVMSSEADCCMGIGLCEKSVDLQRLPGWDKYSYGYHGDDGNFFSSSGSGKHYGPTFTTNDVVGCGLNIVTRTIFYTKNGTSLGTAIKDISNVADLYPVVGIQKHGEILQTNFGQRPFKYNIAVDIQEAIDHTYDSIYHVELSQSKTAWMNHAVAIWLAHEGYSRAFNAFGKFSTESQLADIQKLEPLEKRKPESSESMENRRAISQLLLNGKVDEAISRIEQLYPNLLKHNKELALLLKCQQFVEMFMKINSNLPGKSNASDDMANSSGNQKENISEANKNRFGNPPPKSARLSESYDGFGPSYAIVYNKKGGCFKVTPSGLVVGSKGINVFKRRSGEDAMAFQGRRSSLHTPCSSLSNIHPSTSAVDDDCHSFMDETTDINYLNVSDGMTTASNGLSEASNGNSTRCRNGVSPKSNGTPYSHVSATTIVAEDQDEMLTEYRKDLGEEHIYPSGYTKAELAPFECYQSLLMFGRTVNALSLEIQNIPEELLNIMNDAFALVCQAAPNKSRMAYLMEPSMRERAAHAANSAILRFLGYPEESVLARYFRKARFLRQKLIENQVVSAVFADVDKMVLGERSICA